MSEIRIYAKLAASYVRSSMQHRASFVMSVVRNGISSFGDLARLMLLGFSFGALGGWSQAEIAVLYGIITVSFALANAVGSSLFHFGKLVKSGEFDRLLMRPCQLLTQVMGWRFDLTRFGRLSMGLIGLVWGIVNQSEAFGMQQYLMVAACILSGILLFMGVLMMQGATCFWTIESNEAFNAITYGGISMASYPLEIYQNWLKKLFLYVIPLGFLNYLPCMVLFDKAMPYPAWMAYMGPVAGGLFLCVGLLIWKLGVRHYRSTGS